MTAVLAVLNYIVSVLLSLLGITQSRADQITVNKILAILTDPAVGLNAIHGELTTVLADLASIQGDVLSLGAPQQSGSPVTLPTVPPSGYGGLDAAATGNAVWDAVSADEATTFGTIVAAQSAWLRVFRDSGAMPGRLASWATYNFDPFDLVNNPTTEFLEINAGTILPTHASILDWLNDIYFSVTWNDLGDGTYWANVSSPSGHALVYVTMTPGEFLWLRALATGRVPGTNQPPVWPGLANVTLGAAHAMAAPGEDITIACDGVIIDITGVPSWAGSFSFGTAISWRNVGAVSFTDDNGEQEFPQTLGFAHCVYVPKSMTTASGYAYRVASGVSGTITPFTVN